MIEAGGDINFMPWAIKQCARMAKASAMLPTPLSEIEQAIGDMRLYLRKMHGAQRPRLTLGAAE